MKLMHFGILGVVSVCKGIQVIPDPKEARAIQELQYEIAQSSLQEQKELDIQDAYINLNWYDYKVDPLNAQYAIGILIDPCKTREPSCCQDNFGSPVSNAH